MGAQRQGREHSQVPRLENLQARFASMLVLTKRKKSLPPETFYGLKKCT